MKLVFVYNARSGRWNAALDSAHKLVSPGSYRCGLCAVTHHPLGMKKRWRAFVAALPAEVEFLHRDEAVGRYDVSGVRWPAVLAERPGGAGGEPEATVWLDADRMGGATGLEQLERLILDRLAEDGTDAKGEGQGRGRSLHDGS
ncbi:MAG: hypothetical protein AAGG38_08875 [Planctomycetota bacterium]